MLHTPRLPQGASREAGWPKRMAQTVGDSSAKTAVRHPSAGQCLAFPRALLFSFPPPLFHCPVPCSDQNSRMSCLRSCRLVGTPPPLTSAHQGGLHSCQLAPCSCAKCDMKCESHRRSERVINTPSPCALTNTLLYNLWLQRYQRNVRSVG